MFRFGKKKKEKRREYVPEQSVSFAEMMDAIRMMNENDDDAATDTDDTNGIGGDDGSTVIYKTSGDVATDDAVTTRGNKSFNSDVIMDVVPSDIARHHRRNADTNASTNGCIRKLFAIGVIIDTTIHGYVFDSQGRIVRSTEEPDIPNPEQWCLYYLGVIEDSGERTAFDAAFGRGGYEIEWLGVHDSNDDAIKTMEGHGLDCSKMDVYLDDENTDFI